MMWSECERCGVSEEDNGNIKLENYGGQELCDQCYDEAIEEDTNQKQSEVKNGN